MSTFRRRLQPSKDPTVECSSEPQVVTGPPGTPFGLTAPNGNSLGIGLNCKWTIKPADFKGTRIGIAITDFSFSKDSKSTVKVVDGADTLTPLSESSKGLLPHVFLVEGTSAEVILETDAVTDSSSWFTGFNATYFDASDGNCYNGCSGKGSCTSPGSTCKCEGDNAGADCSTSVKSIQLNTRVSVGPILPSHWQYFKFTLETPANVLVELFDKGHPLSSPYLLLRKDTPPTLKTNDASNWMDWYYDRTDFHDIATPLSPGTWYVGVANHKDRAIEAFNGELIVRKQEDSRSKPCPFDCNPLDEASPRGSCNRVTGKCQCHDNDKQYFGDFCQFGVKDAAFGVDTKGQLRIGDWDYFKITLDAKSASSTLLISFASYSPIAHGALLLRRDKEPYLNPNYLPTLDAFIADFSDADGFELFKGARQNLTITPDKLEPGDYYLGIFNIWGHTGIEMESRDVLRYSLFIESYTAAIPCVRENGSFCNGYPCDKNMGTCKCPSDLGIDGIACEIQSTPMPLDTDAATTTFSLKPGLVQYFFMQISSKQLGQNLVVVLQKPEQQQSLPVLLARKDTVPYSNNYTTYDEHDLTSHFYRQSAHQIVLDSEELTEGVWYFSVVNMAKARDELTFTIQGKFTRTVACPPLDLAGPQGLPCSGRGACDSRLGRCTCEEGSTLDDCSASGVVYLEDGAAVAGPPIPVDGWSFFSMAVGCTGVEVQWKLDAKPDISTMPTLFARRGALPLMYEGTQDYFDFFRGSEQYSHHQEIVVKDCLWTDMQKIECVISPTANSQGTEWATGWAEPGIWFVGVYNDPSKATKPVTNYTVQFSLTGECNSTCADGFLGDRCSTLCPGMVPRDVYSNSPVKPGSPCSGGGLCTEQGDGTGKCACDKNHFGAGCTIVCPGYKNTSNGFTSPSCSGRGECYRDPQSPSARCNCIPQYGNEDCSLSVACKTNTPPKDGKDGLECSGHGVCQQLEQNSRVVHRCECDLGFVGDDCSLQCSRDPVTNELNCSQTITVGGGGVAPVSTELSGGLVALIVVVCVVCVVIFVAFIRVYRLSEARRRELAQMKAPLVDRRTGSANTQGEDDADELFLQEDNPHLQAMEMQSTKKQGAYNTVATGLPSPPQAQRVSRSSSSSSSYSDDENIRETDGIRGETNDNDNSDDSNSSDSDSERETGSTTTGATSLEGVVLK